MAVSDEAVPRRRIRIGQYAIGPSYADEPGKVAIYHESGEGGDFDEADLEAVIATFYAENF